MSAALSASALAARLADTLVADAVRLGARIDDARRRRAGPDAWQRLAADVDRAVARREARRATRPTLVYPAELPVAQRADEIAAAIRAHPVVIVCGETGSGKTTQLPKICMAAGRGERGLIGHTQPRRLAARTVAARIAQELGSAVGAAVGYKVRFTDRTSPDAWVKLMTDGILLAETRGDRDLAAYDTIIVDEAHERSLNIDFLLGYLKQLTARRSDLKLVITSATLDAERFARHFGVDDAHPAPVIEVSGRLYPVEVRYRAAGADPEEETTDDEEDVEEAIVDAAGELWREGPGDILAFLPGEREIRETAERLRADLRRRPWGTVAEILPLYARLSPEEQQRAFTPSRGRRIVLATNVAETSLTVPGIRYVIDTGLARVKRYASRNKTTLLKIEKIARANADQRAGRCGRVQDGICVRLYPEADYAARPRFAEPEILRSSLASVILQMAALDLGAVDAFPFVEPPSPRAIADGYQLLAELGAVDERRTLTDIGRELARLPLDPRIGRIVIAARERGCLAEALVIASALSVPDPRERPLDKAQAADQAHLRFRDDRSDFLSLVHLWQFFAALGDERLSHRRQVDRCREVFVNHLRMREWRDVHRELASLLQESGWQWRAELPATIDAPRYRAIHESLLAGLLSNVGLRDGEGEGYGGPRGLRFHLHPGSGLAKKGGRWILAAELVETTRLYARCAARVEPEWIEAAAGDRVTREWFDPAWDEKRGEVVARERVQLYGLTLVASRPVSLSSLDPAAAHGVFVREALVPGALATSGAFLAHNRRLVAEIAELEHKARRRDVLVDDDTLVAFYAARVPKDIVTTAAFERWRRDAEKRDPKLLFVTRDALMRHAAVDVTPELFPETLDLAGATLPLKYRFAPGHPLDGLALTVPLALLNRLDEAQLSWVVPGLVREKVTWYLKALPKAYRNRLVPLPPAVTAFLESTPPGREPLDEAIRGWLKDTLGDAPPATAWDATPPPDHLRIAVVVVDAAGRELATDRSLAVLRERLGEAAKASFAASGPAYGRSGLRRWEFGDLPETLEVVRDGERLTAYPALVDDGASVSLALADTQEAAEASTRRGVVRLIRIALADAFARHEKGGPGFAQAALALRGAIPTDRLLADVLDAIAERAFLADDPLPRTQKAFDEQVKRARTRLPAVADAAFRLVSTIATAHHSLGQRLADAPPGLGRLAGELLAQRDQLVAPGFASATPWAQLQHLPRYLEAIGRRWAKAREHPEREARHGPQVEAWTRRWRERRDRDRAAGRRDAALDEFRWLLEELKVSLFAQELRTPVPVSLKRVEKAWAGIEGRPA
ncbi:MAG TPA: ATP-dependent RNA helicase HrpA [Casimicrobiaceae bacterium]|nr:ATP-dependent RNA helicase HrpA [Casimicrobiaceae bacterium]